MFHQSNSVVGVTGLCHHRVVHYGEGYAVDEVVRDFLLRRQCSNTTVRILDQFYPALQVFRVRNRKDRS